MMLAGIFLVFFGIGPLIFRLVMRQGWASRRLAWMAVGLFVSGIAIRVGLAAHWGADLGATVAALALLWLGWIVVLVLGVRVLRRRDPSRRMRRWSEIVGALGTTVPWFGLAAAQMMGPG